MAKFLSDLSNLLRSVVSLVILGLVTVAGWFGYSTYHSVHDRDELRAKLEVSEAEVKRLGQDLEVKKQQIARLETAIKLLKVDHRIARVIVLKQDGSVKDDTLVTTFQFVELDREGNPLEEPRTFTIKGDVLYVDGLVVKFADEAVEAGDPLRSTSLFLFRRLFGAKQNPDEGFELDPERSKGQPKAYRTRGQASEFEREIWEKFWHYAASPEEAAKKGIRAIHGEAPFQRLIPGRTYRVEIRASGGTSFIAEPAPGKPSPATVQ